MAMSRDRIKFTVSTGGDRGFKATHEALMAAFNMDEKEANNAINQYRTIICRPSQFARFIVFRYRAGMCINGIKNLDPMLFMPTQQEKEPVTVEITGATKAMLKRALEKLLG
ncbi:MAG: hypothetical protein GY852_05525, partial [bacterium]|nr:hypothetical protein [bacterium]